jgi:very-short-patch-repair endonuclease
MRRWQDCVLDLTKSNPLIGLNRSRVAKLLVVSPECNELFSTFVLGESHLKMPMVRKATGRQKNRLATTPDEDSDLVVEPGDITFDAKPPDLMRCIRRIQSNARTTLEERGVGTLYLTFGALRWKDELLGDSVSPLWMVPCEFESKGPDAPLRLRIADEEAQFNPALEYCLRERHKIELPELPEEPDEKSLMRLLHDVRKAVREQQWQVTEETWLSTFSFESLVIYRDLRALVDVAVVHPVVAALSGAVGSTGKSEALPDNLDSLPTPGTVPIPVLPTDSSQLEALTLSSLRHHVVVHGPPGTGKSQTITNLIADALARNQKVLFVSAKMAALNVVYDRLKELGLQRFCLEAHSTKAGKQKVVDELRRTLEAEANHDGDALERELQALLRVRDELNAYARELHTVAQPFGLTVFRANGRLAQLAGVPDVRGPLPWTNPLETTREDVDKRIQALQDLAGNALAFDQRDTHPWRGFSPERYGLAEQESLEGVCRAAVDLHERITVQAKRLECLIPDACALSLKDWEHLRTMLAALVETECLPNDWWQSTENELTALSQIFAKAAELRREQASISVEIRAAFDGDLGNLSALLSPLHERFGGWLRFLTPSYWRWLKQVRAALRPGAALSRRRIELLSRRCRRAPEITRWLDEQRAMVGLHLETFLTQSPDELAGTARSFTVAGLCKRGLAVVERAPAPDTALSADLRSAAKEILGVIPRADASASPIFRCLDRDWPHGFVGERLASRAAMPEVAIRAKALLAAMPRAREWILLGRVLHRSAELGLSGFLDSLDVSAADAPRIFERRFLKLWLSSAIDRSQTLADFTESKGGGLIDQFQALDERVRRLAIARAQMIASAASARVRKAEEVPEGASEVGILRRELQKRKRSKPLRKLFAEIPHVLQALKPCLLMSPISVSTYLRPELFHFDLVVFDEASQLPTAEAVPAILRASQVVVAGDPNQLPPTSFFQATLNPDGDEENDDDPTSGQVPLESLLDDCVAIVPVFQEAHLRWHYRSRDERLIKFSNHFFYDNHLITFPAADAGASGQGVRFVHVAEGVYDRGRSRMNRPEARVVAKLALEHFDSHPERSLGIVALSQSQKDAIEDAIAEALLARPDLAHFFDLGRQEGAFIKALENVQGDERDTMIISVGYGRDHAGGLSMNFGPINSDGGWRRLNVLVTRAKWECILVSSLRAPHLGGVNPNNRGAVALRGFLEFAERGGELPSEAAVITAAETNDFEEAVRAALAVRGLVVDMQVGASRYRIDLAVRDPRDPRRYVLGIECDGVTYHSSRTARDRDLLRQLVLQRMGWRIHRVWSTEWFHDPEQAIAGILRSVEQAQQAPVERPIYVPTPAPDLPPDPPSSVSPAPQSRPPGAEIPRKYKPGRLYSVFRPPHQLNRDYLLSASYSGILRRTISELVQTEGPIHHDILVERLKEIHGVARAGSNVQANIECALLDSCRSDGVTDEAGSGFYDSPGHQLESFRLPSGAVRRPIEHIAPKELALAILYLVEDQFGVVEESLPAAIAHLVGIERLRGDSAEPIRRVADDLVARGLLRRNGMQLHLA